MHLDEECEFETSWPSELKLIVLEFTLMVCWDGAQTFTVDICFNVST